MRATNRQAIGLVAGLVLGAGMVLAANAPQASAPQPDPKIAQEVRHEIVMYSHYTIFDSLAFNVNNGNVVLQGAVTEPYKKSDLTKIVQGIPGVTSVTNQVEVLPLSPMDNRLRLQIANAIYRDPALSTLGFQALPPIHIIVDNGHVTLEGVVNNTLQKQVAGMRASTTGLSFGPVVNNLKVENPPAKKG
ncbi:MAG: BON domain-containing protein [Acidobacteriia bacterium]|nr:BON domain-containing protein [Terriglobia bacterium]